MQRSLAVPAWTKVLIEWAGGARSNPFNEACVLIANASGAPLELDGVRIRQCVHAGIHHFGGTVHVHRSAIDTVAGSGIHADFNAVLELDSTRIRGAAQDGLQIGAPTVRLGPSSANRLGGNGLGSVRLFAEHLPGFLLQDSIAGNGTDAITVAGGDPRPTFAELGEHAEVLEQPVTIDPCHCLPPAQLGLKNSPRGAPSTLPSRMTTRPRSNVVTGQPRTTRPGRA